MNYNPLTILRMREFGESVISNLDTTDPRISGNIQVAHPDGSSSVVACAYPEVVGDWIYFFSLIDGFVLFAKDQVAGWQQGSVFARTTLTCTPIARSGRMQSYKNETRTLAA